MAAFTIIKKVGSGQTYTTLQTWEDGAPVNYTTAENSAAGTFLVAAFIQGETLSFVGSGAAGKFLDTDSTGAGNGTYISYSITSGNPAASDVVTGATSGATCVLSSSTPLFTGCVWQGKINAASDLFSSSSNLLTIAGGTVSSTAYAELTTMAGASFRDNVNVQTNALRGNTSNGSAIVCTGSYVATLTINQEFTRLSNLQVITTGTAGTSAALQSLLASGTSACDINNCIIEGARGAVLVLFGNAQVVRNSLIVQRGIGRASIADIRNGAKVLNCTLAVPSNLTAATVGVVGAYAAAIFQNTNLFGCTSLSSGTAPSPTTCYTSVASPPAGWTTAAYSTAQFVNVSDTTRDYRLPAGSAMIDVGTSDSINAANDIAGTARPQGSAYDVGCWERVAAGGFIPIIGRGPGLALAGGRGLAG